MNDSDYYGSGSLETTFACERARLVRLCARFTGDGDVAEDLAQETLFEAWCHIHNLRSHDRLPQWLTGIAHNVCLRWARKRGRDLLQLAEPLRDPDASQVYQEDALVDDFDLEIELERKELIEVLDRALALLTPEARALLISRYVEESPVAEVAARMGVHTSVIAMRLQRGKLALRRVFTTELRQELDPYRLSTTDKAGWEETRLWCIACGQRRLVGRYRADENELWLRCPVCCPEPDHFFVYTHSSSLLSGVKGYKRAFSRIFTWVDSYFRPHLGTGRIPCSCGQILPQQMYRPGEALSLPSSYSLHSHCEACGWSDWESLESLVLALPTVQRFYRQHQRVRFLPNYEVEADGRAAIVTSLESITNQDRVVVVSAADTYEVLRQYGNDWK